MRISDWSSDVFSSDLHTCGPLSYDGHRGIDIRLPTLVEMRRGVAVVAAAAGEVLIARDGQPDRPMREAGPGKTVDQRSEEHTSELQPLMRISYHVFCWDKKQVTDNKDADRIIQPAPDSN